MLMGDNIESDNENLEVFDKYRVRSYELRMYIIEYLSLLGIRSMESKYTAADARADGQD
jgi:hypothetical protein